MIKPLLTIIRGFGAKINGKKGTYRMMYNNDEYFLLVNSNLQLLSIAKYITAYKCKLQTIQFENALDTVKEFYPDISGYCNEKEDVAYLTTPDISFDDVYSMTKEEFDKIVREFDDAWIIMFGTVFAMTDPSLFL